MLTTSQSRYDFLRCITFRTRLKYKWEDDGIFIYEPGFEPAQEPVAIIPVQESRTIDGEYGDVL